MQQHKTVPLLSSILSNQEWSILRYMCKGWPSVQIAEIEQISRLTVSKYRSSILRKLGVQNTTQLVYIIKNAKIHGLQQLLEITQARRQVPSTRLGLIQMMPAPGELSPYLRTSRQSAPMAPLLQVAEDLPVVISD